VNAVNIISSEWTGWAGVDTLNSIFLNQDPRNSGIGWTLCENMVHGTDGTIVNPSLRNYRIPSFADVPHSEVYFADTYDRIGPLGAKSQGECAINPVAPAIANAIAHATGVRFPHLPLTPDRMFSALDGEA